MSKNIAHNTITDKIRVSSAVIHYDFVNMYCPYPYEQYETWIFSKDPNQKSRQIIHGTHSQESETLKQKTIKIHNYIVNNLILYYKNSN